VAKTDGVPLFVEELTKTVLESGLLREHADHYELTGPFPALAIPATLQDSLMARLDRLSTVKTVAQLGATIGRQFAYDLLQAISPLDEDMLQQGLRQLVEAELLYQRGIPPQATYVFKHALIQDTAYQSLLRSTRQQYHQRIAQVLEAQFLETAEMHPELLAHHYTEAGHIEQAIGYWQRAGEHATRRSAHMEAVAHLTKGLKLLATQSDTPERAQRELACLMTLGTALTATKGLGAPEAEQIYTRALALCQPVGQAEQLSQVLWGLRRVYHVRGEYRKAWEVGKRILKLAQGTAQPHALLMAHTALGPPLLCLGELVAAQAHLEQGMALYDSEQHRPLLLRYEQGGVVTCLNWLTKSLWLLGYPAQALQRGREAIAKAGDSIHGRTLALLFVVEFHQCRREVHATQERAEAAIALSTEQGFPDYLAKGIVLRGWALAMQGQRDEGIDQIQQGLAAHRATGSEGFRPYYLALLAEAHGSAGQVDAGLGVLAEALRLVDDMEGYWYQAELYRLKGELLLGLSTAPHAEATACFEQALDIARHQQAKSLELRAAASLARLWQRQGKRAEARELLAEVYGWFTEGVDTADLQEARALLEALG